MIEQIKLSIQGNIQHLRNATTVYHDLVINLALASVGVVVYLVTSGWVSWLGVVWALINLMPIFFWVIDA